MITTAIVHNRRNKTGNGELPLEVRVTIDRKTYYIGTGIKVRASEWKAGTIVNRPNADILTARLNAIYRKVEEEINAAIEAGGEIDVADIKRRAWVAQVDASSTSLLEWLTQQVDSLHMRDGTLKHYRSMVLRLKEFDGMRRWNDLTVENIYKWDAWLHQSVRGRRGEHITDAAVYNYHKCLKKLLNMAVLFDRIQHNPYDKLKGKFKRGERNVIDYLTDEEMAAIESLRPVPGSKAAVARDLFVFQMYTGMAFADAEAFNMGDYKLIDGTWRHQGERVKTGVAYVSQLLPPVVEILERYGWKVPQIDNADYNSCLKPLGTACGIERPLHSHMARHTFATWVLRHGIPIEHVSKMLGHTNISQTQRYAKVVAEDIHEDFEILKNDIKRNREA